MTDLDETIRRSLRQATDPVATIDRDAVQELLGADRGAVRPLGRRRWRLGVVGAAAAAILLGVLVATVTGDGRTRVDTQDGTTTSVSTVPSTTTTASTTVAPPTTVDTTTVDTVVATPTSTAPPVTPPIVSPRPAPTTTPPLPISAAPVGSLHARIEIAHSVRAGAKASGTVVLDNGAGRPIEVTACWNIYGITLHSPTFDGSASGLGCAQVFTIPVGESRWPVEVSATVDGCQQPGSPSPSGDLPPCLPDPAHPLPPLPPGRYRAHVWTSTGLPVPPDFDLDVIPAA